MRQSRARGPVCVVLRGSAELVSAGGNLIFGWRGPCARWPSECSSSSVPTFNSPPAADNHAAGAVAYADCYASTTAKTLALAVAKAAANAGCYYSDTDADASTSTLAKFKIKIDELYECKIDSKEFGHADADSHGSAHTSYVRPHFTGLACRLAPPLLAPTTLPSAHSARYNRTQGLQAHRGSSLLVLLAAARTQLLLRRCSYASVPGVPSGKPTVETSTTWHAGRRHQVLLRPLSS